jgi:LacI family transcriptional regulator
MKFEPVTIKDIGKALGLSTSTVSRALRGSYEISAETKKLVLEYAERINYRPNPIALSLKERRNHSIGVIVCEIANNFFSQAISGIDSIAYNSGYHVIISQSHESFERETVITDYLASRSVDGLLVSVSSETKEYDHFKQLYEKGLPIVFFDRVVADINTHKVIADNFKGAYDATEHLIANGFKRIAHITSAPYLSISQERLQGYQTALQKNNIAFDEKLVHYCYHGGMIYDEVEESLKKIFKLPVSPDALFTAGDRITTTCIAALQKLGKKIPADIAVIGFTNSNLSEVFNPPLSVVRQPAFEIGQVATELLISMIESKRPVTEFSIKVLQTELVIRESSARN